MRFCRECGSEVSSEMRFCGQCGAPLYQGESTVSYAPVFTEEEEEPSSEAMNGAALIELDQVEGTAGRRMHDLEGHAVTVGRDPESDIAIDDVTVSREHAEVSRDERGFRIRDAGSLNGTYVNRVRVDAVELRNGDEIQVGKYRFKFVFT